LKKFFPGIKKFIPSGYLKQFLILGLINLITFIWLFWGVPQVEITQGIITVGIVFFIIFRIVYKEFSCVSFKRNFIKIGNFDLLFYSNFWNNSDYVGSLGVISEKFFFQNTSLLR